MRHAKPIHKFNIYNKLMTNSNNNTIFHVHPALMSYYLIRRLRTPHSNQCIEVGAHLYTCCLQV